MGHTGCPNSVVPLATYRRVITYGKVILHESWVCNLPGNENANIGAYKHFRYVVWRFVLEESLKIRKSAPHHF